MQPDLVGKYILKYFEHVLLLCFCGSKGLLCLSCLLGAWVETPGIPSRARLPADCSARSHIATKIARKKFPVWNSAYPGFRARQASRSEVHIEIYSLTGLTCYVAAQSNANSLSHVSWGRHDFLGVLKL